MKSNNLRIGRHYLRSVSIASRNTQQPASQINYTFTHNFIHFSADTKYNRGGNIRSFSTTPSGTPDPSGRTWVDWYSNVPAVTPATESSVPTDSFVTPAEFKPSTSTEEFVAPVQTSENFDAIPSLDPASITTVDVAAAIVDNSAAIGVVLEDPAKLNFVIAGVMELVDYVHIAAGMPYFAAIAAVTIAFRLCMLPVALKTMQGSARMAVMRPEMQKLQDVMNKGNYKDPQHQMRFQQEMKALWVKHKVNPFRAMLWPLAQFPVFMAFFWALKDMGTYYPAMATGGAMWFTDLSVADPTYILPIINSLTFLIMIELGSDGMPTAQQGTFKWVMRGLAVVMVPITAPMPSGLFIYWGANNSISILQAAFLKMPKMKKMFDIPEMPTAEDTPQMKMQNPFTAISEALAKERSQGKDAQAEILHGVTSKENKAPVGPPPMTFDRRQTRPKV
jgi:YidC/Oxa1 family membrane protein insertase